MRGQTFIHRAAIGNTGANLYLVFPAQDRKSQMSLEPINRKAGQIGVDRPAKDCICQQFPGSGGHHKSKVAVAKGGKQTLAVGDRPQHRQAVGK